MVIVWCCLEPEREAGQGSEEGRCLGEVLLWEAGLSGEGEGEGLAGLLWGERSSGSALPGDGHHCCHCCAVCQGILCCHQRQMLCARIHCQGRSLPPTTSYNRCQVMVHPLLCGSQGSTLLPLTGVLPTLRKPPRLAGLIVGPPGWVLLSQACSAHQAHVASPGCRPLHPLLTPSSHSGRGLALRHFWGI